MTEAFGRRMAVRGLGVVLLGLVMGALTSLLQKYLDFPWLSLVNAASPWLAPAFAAGAVQRRLPAAALAGLTTCGCELIGYYLTAAVRGYFAGGGHGILFFWTACAVVGGPIFGAAGLLWRRDSPPGLGASVPAAAFLVEAGVVYAWHLHYTSSAILFAAIGVALLVVLGRRHYLRMLGWLMAVAPLGVLAELAVDLVYARSF